MSYLITIAALASLLIGFLVMVRIERAMGKRLLAATRGKLDKKVERSWFIAEHIDWGGFVGHIFKLSIERVAHDIIHVVLLFVRTLERFLTRAIRGLRESLARRSSSAVPTEGFQLRSTLRQFRKTFRKDNQ